MLSAKVRCIEYNDDIYTSEPIENFTEATNTSTPIWDVNATPMPPYINYIDTMELIPKFIIQTVFPNSIYDTVELSYSRDEGSTWNVHSTLTNTYDYYKQNDGVDFVFDGYPTGTYLFRCRISYNGTWSSYSDISQPFEWLPNSTVYIPGTSYRVYWNTSGTVPDGGPYGQTITLSIYNEANNNVRVDYSTSSTDAGLANNTWRLVSEGIQPNGWKFNDITSSTTTDTITYTVANTANSNDMTTAISPIISLKERGRISYNIAVPPGYMYKTGNI